MNRISLVIFSLFLSSISFAQLGANDPTFNPTDIGFGNGDGYGDTIFVCKRLANGKQIIAGTSYIAKLDTLGKLDTTFNVVLEVYTSTVFDLEIQPDNKIIVVGRFTTINGASANRISRLNEDGSLDLSFQSGTGFNAAVYCVSIMPNGKLVVSGNFTQYNGTSVNGIVILNSDGSLDNSFNPGTAANNKINDIAIDINGDIIIAGNFTSFNGFTVGRLAKIDGSGNLISGFNTSTGANWDINSIFVQSNGKIIVGGVFTSYNGFGRNSLIRIENNGDFDPTFDTSNGFNSGANISRVMVQFDGKVLAAGIMNSYQGYTRKSVLRLNQNGTLDLSFNVGSGFFGLIKDVAPDPLGRTLCVGFCSSFNNYTATIRNVCRVLSDGLFDFDFNRSSGADNDIFSTSVQPDGKIIIGGNFMRYNGIHSGFIERVNTDGSKDNLFNNGIGTNGNVYITKIQSDGKILLGGLFTQYNGTTINRIARLNTDGTLDVSFNPGTGVSGPLRLIDLQQDGKIVIGGDFLNYNGNTSLRLARINVNGSFDPSFNVGSGPNGTIKAVKVQSDGKILIGGNFSQYNGITRPLIARLNSNGTLDNTFTPIYLGGSEVETIDIDTNGKIILGGLLTVQSAFASVVRLNTDGTIDNSFVIGATNGDIRSSLILPDSRILVGGYFSEYNGIVVNNLAYLNSDGTLYNNVGLNGGTNNAILSLSEDNSGNVVLAGAFTSYDNAGRNRIARSEFCYFNDPVDTIIACDHFQWINGMDYTSSGIYIDTIEVIGSCDTILTLDLTILNSSNAAEIRTACGSYIWPINNQTYTVSGQYIDTIPNAVGCDSIITLDLTIIPDLPLTLENSFSMPSDANSCVGEAAIDLSGNAPFELDFDNGSQILTSNGYSLVTGLCAGIHDLHVTDNCGDTLSIPVVIPVDSNYVFNNPFIDSLALDSLGVTMTNCDIFYNGIDTAYIDSIWANGNTVNVIWNIVDSNGSNFDTTSYVLNNGNGVYWLQLSVFCPFKSANEYFTVTEAIYFQYESTASLTDIGKNLFEIYPNPTNDQVHITFSGPEAELTVYDVQGKVVFKDQIQNQGIVLLQNFERGVYLFDFKNSQGQSVQRVVKQ